MERTGGRRDLRSHCRTAAPFCGRTGFAGPRRVPSPLAMGRGARSSPSIQGKPGSPLRACKPTWFSSPSMQLVSVLLSEHASQLRFQQRHERAVCVAYPAPLPPTSLRSVAGTFPPGGPAGPGGTDRACCLWRFTQSPYPPPCFARRGPFPRSDLRSWGNRQNVRSVSLSQPPYLRPPLCYGRRNLSPGRPYRAWGNRQSVLSVSLCQPPNLRLRFAPSPRDRGPPYLSEVQATPDRAWGGENEQAARNRGGTDRAANRASSR